MDGEVVAAFVPKRTIVVTGEDWRQLMQAAWAAGLGLDFPEPDNFKRVDNANKDAS